MNAKLSEGGKKYEEKEVRAGEGSKIDSFLTLKPTIHIHTTLALVNCNLSVTIYLRSKKFNCNNNKTMATKKIPTNIVRKDRKEGMVRANGEVWHNGKKFLRHKFGSVKENLHGTQISDYGLVVTQMA